MQMLNQFYPYIFEETLDWTFLKVHIPLNKKLKKEVFFSDPKSHVLTVWPPLASTSSKGH